jgi:8-hydroxy-5-deazaflavin:NADPH oxidoreductase
MKIGIIGTGLMGRALGLRWARAGHRVLFGSRDLDKARATAASAPAGSAESGDTDAAAAFGEVVVYTVRDVLPSRLLREPGALDGKIVIDLNNRDVGNDSRASDIRVDRPPPPGPSLAEKIAADAPGARVVKAFNTLPFTVIERERGELSPHRVSVFVSGDDPAARSVVVGLAEELGFVGVDSGELRNAWMLEALADFLRYQIGGKDLGMLATISVHVLPRVGG